MTTSATGAARLRVLMGAYACGPDEDPESSAAWAFAVAAARHHDVRVVTRHRFRPLVDAALEEDPELAAHLVVDYLDLPPWVVRRKRRSWDLYWYYVGWQRALTRHVRRLQEDFDVVHHVTFANDWLPCGLSGLDLPLVWGPVGGASRVPVWRMRRWLGLRGVLTEATRELLTSASRRATGDRVAARAAVVVAQNPAVAQRFHRARRVEVEPNACLAPGFGARTTRNVDKAADSPRTALFVGRLNAWKGGRLAVATLAHPRAASWRLRIYGEGYERAAILRLAAALGVADRVEMRGHRPRAEVLQAFVEADALLFPSLHDQAGWVAAEASSLGCPVVCLPLGGPPLLAERNGFVASLEGDVVANLAQQLEAAGRAEGVAHDRWSTTRLPALLQNWYADALTTREPPS